MASLRTAAKTATVAIAGALGLADIRTQLAAVDEQIAAGRERTNALTAERDELLEAHPLEAEASKKIDGIEAALEAEHKAGDRLLVTRGKLARRIAAEEQAKAGAERAEAEANRRKHFARLFDHQRKLAIGVDEAADQLRDHLAQLVDVTAKLRLEIDPQSSELSQVLNSFSAAAGTVINDTLFRAGAVCGKAAPFLEPHKKTVLSWLPDARYLASLVKPRLVE